MRHNQATFNAALLSPPVRDRFQSIFSVAERKSIFAWQEVPISRAELLVLDSEPQNPDAPEPACAIVIGLSANEATSTSNKRFQLRSDFTVSELLDILDRAAVWLLEWRSRQQSQTPLPTSEASTLSYKLRRWITLPKEFSTRNHMRALALLTREPLTLARLCAHSGLQTSEGRHLLEELTRREALLVTTVSERASRSSTPAAGTRRDPGLLSKLSGWLTKSRPVATHGGTE